MDPVIFIQLALPDVAPLPNFSQWTTLLTDTHRFKTHVVLGFCDSALKKRPEFAGIFNEVPPLNGGWTLEIAVELPDLLPSLDGKSEAVVVTKSNKYGNRELCLSNRMSRFHYQDGDTPYHVLLPRDAPWHGYAQVKGENGQTLSAAEEQLRTVAAMRFPITGENTEQAFERAIKGSLTILFDSINRVLQATRECRTGFVPVSRAVSEDSVPSVYVLMLGSARIKGAVLALSGARVSLNPEVLEGDKAAKFRQIADCTIPLDDVDRLVGEARSSWESGEYEFSFLQAVIAAEIATARAVRLACRQKGVSKNKLDNARKEMTYSWALNVGLPLALEPAIRPQTNLINAMNVARDKRNDLMHEAKFSMNRAELGQLLIDTRSYVDALKEAARTIAQQIQQHEPDSATVSG